MRVAINTALMGSGKGYRQTGIYRYISELISALRIIIPADDRLLTPGSGTPLIANHPMARILWEQTLLPASLLASRADLIHGPISVVPLLSTVPSVVTVHDLAFLKFANQVTAARRAWLIPATRLSARKARRIIAVSEFTRQDVLDWLQLPEDRVVAVPNAPSPRIRRVTGAALDAFRQRWQIDRPYVLAVGTLEPRKNLTTLLRAFAAIKDDLPHQLILVGPEGWLTGELKATLDELRLGDRIRLTGFVTDEELGGWYSAADLFAFPSHYEGFGLPVVEAQRCGAPVLSSNTSAFPGVVGEAGVMLPPTDQDAWAEMLRALLQDDARRNDLRARGLVNAERYSWEATARATLAIYREAVNA